MFRNFATVDDMSPEIRAKYQHCGLVPEFPYCEQTAVPVEEVRRDSRSCCLDDSCTHQSTTVLAPAEIKNKQTSLEDSQTVENTWVRKDYQTSRFVIIDGSQAVKGAPRWNQVYRRDTFSLPDNKLIQRIISRAKTVESGRSMACFRVDAQIP